jgi:hypothetical protein
MLQYILETNICQACQRCEIIGNDLSFPGSTSALFCPSKSALEVIDVLLLFPM